MMDQKQFDALLDQWIEDHKQEMIEELGLWVSQKSVSRVDLGAPGAPYGPDCRKMLDLALEMLAAITASRPTITRGTPVTPVSAPPSMKSASWVIWTWCPKGRAGRCASPTT